MKNRNESEPLIVYCVAIEYNNHDVAADPVESDDYVGVNTVVDRELRNLKKNATTNLAVGLSYLHDDVLNNEVPDDGGTSDPYDGLDRFGRVVYQNWYNLGDRRVMAYDADGNLLYSKVPFPNVYTKWRSEIYHLQGANAFTAYDHFNRQQAFYRGVMQADNRTVTQDPIEVTPGQFIDRRETSLIFDLSPGSGDFTTTAKSDSELVNQGQAFQKDRPSVNSYFDVGAALTDTKRRDTFLTYDAWGQLTKASFASLAGDDGTHTYQYTRTFDNNYEYDALGRRIKEQEMHRDEKIEVTDLYYDVRGRDIQEIHSFITDSNIPAQVTRYVWSAAAAGMMIVRDDTVNGAPRRVWSMQSTDGSASSLYEQGTGGSAKVEHVVYSPQGLATFLSPNLNLVSSYAFTDLGTLDWRFTWKGSRTVRDQDRSIYGNQTDASIVDRQSGLLFLNGSSGPAYDSSSGTPLLEDKYAFFRPSSGSGQLAVNAHKFSTRGTLNTQFPFNGSNPFWDANWALQQQVLNIGVMGLSMGAGLMIGAAVGGMGGMLLAEYGAGGVATAGLLGNVAMGAFQGFATGYGGGKSRQDVGFDTTVGIGSAFVAGGIGRGLGWAGRSFANGVRGFARGSAMAAEEVVPSVVGRANLYASPGLENAVYSPVAADAGVYATNLGAVGESVSVNVGVAKSAGAGASLIARGAQYDVGEYVTLRDIAESGLDAHHVGQKALMQRFIPGYDLETAPSILVPKVGHTIRDLELGIVSRSTSGFTNAREVIARDIWELRRVYPNIPNSQLQRLIDMNKRMYPVVGVRSAP